jgi:PAS domain S-box-containing protein
MKGASRTNREPTEEIDALKRRIQELEQSQTGLTEEAPRQALSCLENINIHKDGRKMTIETSGAPIIDARGNFLGYRGFDRDITELRQVGMRLKESEERYRTAVEHSNDAVALERGGLHMCVNQRFLDMFGYESFDDFIEGEEHKEAHPDDRKRVMEYSRKRQRGEPAPSRYEYKGVKREKTEICIEASMAVIVHEGEPASLAYLRDITERKKMEKKLEAMSPTDELTVLCNRRGFPALSRQQLKLAESKKGYGVILY